MGVLSLAALSILDAGPIGQVYAAKAGGFRSVGLRLQPLLATDQAIVGDAEREAALLAALAQTGLSVLEIGVFPLKADTRVSDFEPVVGFSARIGARYLVCPIEDEDEARRVRTFAAMCDLAADYGMEALVEFNPYSGCRSLADAAALAAAAGRPNGKLLIDVLHLSRSGGSPADVRAIDPASVPLVHFCDAPPPPAQEEERLRPPSSGRPQPSTRPYLLPFLQLSQLFPLPAAQALCTGATPPLWRELALVLLRRWGPFLEPELPETSR